MMYFSSSVAGYLEQHSKHDVAILNDWHCAYSIELLSIRQEKNWLSGKTPANVLVIHNNSYGCQGIYGEVLGAPSVNIPSFYLEAKVEG